MARKPSENDLINIPKNALQQAFLLCINVFKKYFIRNNLKIYYKCIGIHIDCWPAKNIIFETV